VDLGDFPGGGDAGGLGGRLRALWAAAVRAAREELDGEVLMERLGASKVSWNLVTVGIVLVAWLAGFTVVGGYLVPGALNTLGVDRFSMTMRSTAVMHLLIDLWQCLYTIALLWFVLRQHKPRRLGLFPVSLKLRTWLPYVLVGIGSFPCVEAMANAGALIFPEETDSWAQGLGETLLSCDPVTAAAYFLVVSVCAPLWEEVMFRGFLMPSFAKYFRVPGAAVASALLFSMAHFSLSRSLPLTLLGVVIGVLFAASRNLTTAVALHAAWNFWVLITIGSRL